MRDHLPICDDICSELQKLQDPRTDSKERQKCWINVYRDLRGMAGGLLKKYGHPSSDTHFDAKSLCVTEAANEAYIALAQRLHKPAGSPSATSEPSRSLEFVTATAARAYLCHTVIRILMDEFNRCGRESEKLGVLAQYRMNDLSELASFCEQGDPARAQQALEQLAAEQPEQHQAFTLYFLGCPYRLIAMKLGVAEENARKLVSRAKAFLRDRAK